MSKTKYDFTGNPAGPHEARHKHQLSQSNRCNLLFECLPGLRHQGFAKLGFHCSKLTKNKRNDTIKSNVLGVYNPLAFFFIKIQADESQEVRGLDGKMVRQDDSDSTGTESESESSEDVFNVSNQSSLSGSINYFVAPLDSSETQAMVIEELNQVRLNPHTQGFIFASTVTHKATEYKQFAYKDDFLDKSCN